MIEGRRDSALVLTMLCLAVTVLWAAILSHWHLEGRPTALDRIEAPLIDLRFLIAGPRPPPRDILIVAIDDDTVREFGSFPLPRGIIAMLVNRLAAQRPRVLALDLLFLDPSSEIADAGLAQALRDSGAVVGAVALFLGSESKEAPTLSNLAAVPVADRILWPEPVLLQASKAGVVNVATDHAGTPRHVPLLVRSADALVPSFALRTASAAAGTDAAFGFDNVQIGSIATNLDFGYYLPLRFLGPRGTIPTISARQVLHGESPPNLFAGKIVLIGATATATGDAFTTPFEAILPGVEVLGTAVAQLTSRETLVRDRSTRMADAGAAILLPIVAILLMSVRRVGLALGLVGALVASWIAFTFVVFVHGYWLNLSVPLAALIPSLALYVTSRLVYTTAQSRRLAKSEAALRLFQPPAFAKQLAADPEFLAEPVDQEAAVLFIDLSGFTGVSESLGPQKTRQILHSFHQTIEDIVTRERGVVLSFMGDGAIIVFGLPSADRDDPVRAVTTALALCSTVSTWIVDLSLEPSNSIGVRIGGHIGPVVVSRLGHSSHQQITAAGDTVNVASRLMEIAKQYRTTIALSSELLRRAKEAGLRYSATAFSDDLEIILRGRVQPLLVKLWQHRSEESNDRVDNA
jgi:adenylate cyclase